MTQILIYSTTICPYCVKAKNLLNRKNYKYKEINVDDEQDRINMIKKAGGKRTVPQIFIGDTHVGGCDDLYALDAKGGLDKLMAK